MKTRNTTRNRWVIASLFGLATLGASLSHEGSARAASVAGCTIQFRVDKTVSCLAGKLSDLTSQLADLPKKLMSAVENGKNFVKGKLSGFSIFGCGVDWTDIGNTMKCLWGVVEKKIQEGKQQLMGPLGSVDFAGCKIDWGNLWNTVTCVGNKIQEAAGKLANQLAEASSGFLKDAENYLNKHIGDKIGCPIKITPVTALGAHAASFLKCAGSKLLNAVENFVAMIKEKAMETINAWIAAAKKKVWEVVVKPAIDKLKEFVQAATDKIVDRLVDEVIGSRVVRWINEAMKSGKEAYGYLKHKLDKLDALLEDLSIDGLVDWVKGEGISRLLGYVQPLLKSVLDSARAVLGNARTAIQGVVGSIPFGGGALAGAIGVAFDEGLSAIFGVVDKTVVGYVKELATDLATAAKRVFKENLDGAQTAIGRIVQVLRGPLNAIVAKVKPRLEKYLKMADKIRQLANAIPAGAAQAAPASP